MPIIQQRTNLNTLQYSSGVSPASSPDDDKVPISIAPTTGVPFVTIPVPKVEDKFPNANNIRITTTDGIILSNNSEPGKIRDALFAAESGRGRLFSGTLLTTIGGASYNISNPLSSTDFSNNFIRGGIRGVQQSILRDVSRIGAFLKSLPEGTIFKIKQQNLQKSNILFEAKGEQKEIYDITNRQIISYNSDNTLFQVRDNALGTHYFRHGSKPERIGGVFLDIETYYSHAYSNSGITNNSIDEANKNNRLLSLLNREGLNIQSPSRGIFVKGIASAPPPPNSASISTSNPINFGFLDRISRGQQNIPTIRQFKQRAEASIVGIEDRIRQSIGRTRLGSVVLASLQALGVNTNISVLGRNTGVGGSVGPIGGYTPPRSETRTAQNILYEYKGGPGSLYGEGDTVIRRYSFTADPDKIKAAFERASDVAGKAIQEGENRVIVNTANAASGSTNNSILERAIGKSSSGNSQYPGNAPISLYPGVPIDMAQIARSIGQSPIQGDRTYANIVTAINAPLQADFNKLGIFVSNIDKQTYTNNGSYSTTGTTKIEYRNTYNAKVTLREKSWSRVAREERVGSGKQDSINLTPLFNAEIGFKNPKSRLKINGKGEYNINDLVTFKIEGIDTDNPLKSIHMVFRAYLTDFSDGVSAEWNDVTYAGRGDKFYIYKGFDRKIEIGFKVAALSSEEMEPMYQKLNNLMGNLLPDYQNSIMRGPLVRMTVGNWIDSQPGILTSLSYTIPQDSPWEISIEDKEKMLLPHVVEVKLSFTPIGAQHKKENKIMNKASKTLHTSYIAQNYNGDKSGEPNYINGNSIGDASPYEPPPPSTNTTAPSGLDVNALTRPPGLEADENFTPTLITNGAPSVPYNGIPLASEYINNNNTNNFNSLVLRQQPTNYVVDPNARKATTTEFQFPTIVNFGRR